MHLLAIEKKKGKDNKMNDRDLRVWELHFMSVFLQTMTNNSSQWLCRLILKLSVSLEFIINIIQPFGSWLLRSQPSIYYLNLTFPPTIHEMLTRCCRIRFPSRSSTFIEIITFCTVSILFKYFITALLQLCTAALGCTSPFATKHMCAGRLFFH